MAIEDDAFTEPTEGVRLALGYELGSKQFLSSQRQVDFWTYLWNVSDRELTFYKSFTAYELTVWDTSGNEVSDYHGWLEMGDLIAPTRSDWVTLVPGEMIRVRTKFMHPQRMGLSPGDYRARVRIHTGGWNTPTDVMAPGDSELVMWQPQIPSGTNDGGVVRLPATKTIEVFIPH